MLRRSIAALFVFTLVCTIVEAAAAIQVKEMPKTAPKSINAQASAVDINSASETEITALGIDKAVAKKIVEGRPYRSKRELVSKKLLTPEQYDKLKDKFVAKQPKKGE